MGGASKRSPLPILIGVGISPTHPHHHHTHPTRFRTCAIHITPLIDPSFLAGRYRRRLVRDVNTGWAPFVGVSLVQPYVLIFIGSPGNFSDYAQLPTDPDAEEVGKILDAFAKSHVAGGPRSAARPTPISP